MEHRSLPYGRGSVGASVCPKYDRREAILAIVFLKCQLFGDMAIGHATKADRLPHIWYNPA
jgi:hypothetical protein